MNVEYSKDFEKSVKKLVGYRNVYRIRIGDYRAFFTFHIEIVNDTVFFI